MRFIDDDAGREPRERVVLSRRTRAGCFPGSTSLDRRPRRSRMMADDHGRPQAIVQPALHGDRASAASSTISAPTTCVGYYSHAKADGKFHKITVRVKRPGVQVRARAGYLAAKAAEAAKPIDAAPRPSRRPKAKMLTQALSPLSSFSRELPLRVRAAAAWTPATCRDRARRCGSAAQHGDRRRLEQGRAGGCDAA